jgi:gag-polypeptide of LTR copia-type
MSQESIGTGVGSHITIIIRETVNVNTSLKLTSVLLNGKNYQAWAKSVRISLKGKDKLEYINGSRIRPTTAIEVEE